MSNRCFFSRVCLGLLLMGVFASLAAAQEGIPFKIDGYYISCVAFTANGKTMAVGCSANGFKEGVVHIVDSTKLFSQFSLKQPEGVLSMAIAPSGKVLAVCIDSISERPHHPGTLDYLFAGWQVARRR